MTIVIDLSPEAEQHLREEAEARGIPESDCARDLLGETLEAQRAGTEEDFQRAMVAAGLMLEAKVPLDPNAPYKRVPPVRITGKPLSETIIEERRRCLPTSQTAAPW